MKKHNDFKSKYQENDDEHTKGLAFEKMVAEIMNKDRRTELELYKLFAGDQAFKASLLESLKKALL